MDYVIQKSGRHWQVNGEGWYTRKRDAEAAIANRIAADAYQAHCIEDDANGSYRWTPEEEAQIAEYADVLRVNAERWSLWGKDAAQNLARAQHAKDQAVLDGPRERWIDPDRYFREKRRTMAARLEAFKRAGATL